VISAYGDVDIHYNIFDLSCVEYHTLTQEGFFEIFFDDKLFEAPPSIIELEKSLFLDEE